VLRADGTLWLNLGSSYCSTKTPSQKMKLRDDLSLEQIAYVLEELASHVKK
jgi:hypothetical protein